MHEGSISLGDELVLGPFAEEVITPRDRNHGSGAFPSSLIICGDRDAADRLHSPYSSSLGMHPQTHEDSSICVRVISLRNLRLPVRSLLAGQVGTIGVVPHRNAKSIDRARKGMILKDQSVNISAHRSFTAMFSSIDFTSVTSPTLIIGGHAVVYVNAVRAAVRVRSMAFPEEDFNEPDSPQDDCLFGFHSGGSDDGFPTDQVVSDERRTIKITFQFVSSVEWLRAGDKILVIPTTSATGPVAGPIASNQGLDGFVGVVCESEA